MNLHPIVVKDAPITCVTKLGDQTIICRANGTITGSLTWESPLIEVIAVVPVSTDRFVGIDKDGSVHFFSTESGRIERIKTVMADSTIRPILNQAMPGTGVSESDYNGDIVYFESYLFLYRFDRNIVRMTSDQIFFSKRWYSPLIVMNNTDQTSVVVPQYADSVVAGIASNSTSVFTALFPSTLPQTVGDMIMHLTRSTPSCTLLESMEIPNMLLETFAKIFASDTYVFIQTRDCAVRVIELTDSGMRLHSIVSGPVGGPLTTVSPSPAVKRLNSLPPLPVADTSTPLFPRYNPQLNVLRKHSQPVAYSSISETLLNLSLSTSSDNVVQPTGSLLTMRDTPKLSLRSLALPDEVFVANEDGQIFVLTLDRPPFSYIRVVSPEKWVSEWAATDTIGGVLCLPENFSCVMKSNKLEFIVPSSIQCCSDLVIQLLGGGTYSRLSLDHRGSDLCVESVWERRSLAIIPGSHSVVSFDGEEGDDTSPRAKQRTSGFSVVDAGVVVCEKNGKFTDLTCEYSLKNGMKLHGTFDGEVLLMRDQRTVSQIPVSHSFSIESVVGDLPGEHILVGDRGGSLFELVLDDASEECLWLMRRHDIGVMPVKIQKLNHLCLIHSGDRIWISQCETIDLKQVHLGYPFLLKSVIGQLSDDRGLCVFALTDDGKHILRVTIDSETNTAEFSVRLPFEQASSVAVDGDHLFILGTIPRMNQRALLEVELKHKLIGALESSETISLSSVLPFDSLKEEPVCVGIWHNSDFASSLVVVGTHGKTRGRIIIFDRSSMTPICKTSVPSRQVSAVEPLSQTVLAVGCTECVVVVGLTTVDEQITLVTLAVYQTYTLVRHVNRVTDHRFLIVQSNGVVVLLELKGDTIIQIGALDSQRHVVSPCVVLSNDTFMCSTIQGDQLEFNIGQVDTTGVMKQLSTSRFGSSIEYFHRANDGTLVSMSNGSIFLISTN